MIPFLPESLHSTGAVPFMTAAVTGDTWIGEQAYTAQFPLGDAGVVAAGDAYSGGVRYTVGGAVRLVDATAGLPAGSVVRGGFAVSSSGQLCYTTDAPDSTSVFIGGVACLQDGRVHAQLVSPAAWFRFNKGITSASALVSQWSDQTSNARHLKQSTGTNQPTLQADGSILFDGVDNFLKADAFTFSQPLTVYLLFKQVTYADGDTIFDGETAASGMLFQQTTSGRLKIFAGNVVADNDNLALDTYAVVSVVLNGAGSLLGINNTAPTTGDAGAQNMAGFTLAARPAPSFYSNIQVKEVMLVAAAHAAATRARIIRYLASVGTLTL